MSSAILSGPIKISWTVQNIGSIAAPDTWSDAVFVGNSPAFDQSKDTFISSFDQSSQSPLLAGASYTENESVTLPVTAPTGADYVIFVTNYEAVEQDGSGQGETNYANDTFAVPITVSAPDLTITSAQAPSSTISGAATSVSWTVKNAGSAGAPGNWNDAVYIGSTPSFSATTDTFVASFRESSQSPLSSGATYTDSESITLPAKAGTGSEYLFFVTNYDAVQQDGSGQGETNYANNTYSVPITVSAPDLTVTTASAPASAIVGAATSVSWTVKDIGSVAAPGDWYDAVYVGTSSIFNANSDTFVANFSENSQSPLAADASYTDSEKFTLPAPTIAGDDYLIFVTNYYAVENEFYESNQVQGETSYSNNTFAVPIAVSAPDLTITTASAPSSAIVGASFGVSWTVKNVGKVAAPRHLVRLGLRWQFVHVQCNQRHTCYDL